MANAAKLIKGILKGADKTAKKILVDFLDNPKNITTEGNAVKNNLKKLKTKEIKNKDLEDLINVTTANGKAAAGARDLLGSYKTGIVKDSLEETQAGGFKLFQEARREVKGGLSLTDINKQTKARLAKRKREADDFYKNLTKEEEKKINLGMDRKETVNVKTLSQLERVRKRARQEALFDEKIQKQISEAARKGGKIEDPRYGVIEKELNDIAKKMAMYAYRDTLKNNVDIAKKAANPKNKDLFNNVKKRFFRDAKKYIEEGGDASRLKGYKGTLANIYGEGKTSVTNRFNVIDKIAKQGGFIEAGKNKTDRWFTKKNIEKLYGKGSFPIDDIVIRDKRSIQEPGNIIIDRSTPEGSAAYRTRQGRTIDAAIDPRMPGAKPEYAIGLINALRQGKKPVSKPMGPSVELNPRYEIDRPRRTIQQFDKETLNKLKERRAQIQEYRTKYPDKFKLDPKTEKTLRDEEFEINQILQAERFGVAPGGGTSPRARSGAALAEEVTRNTKVDPVKGTPDNLTGGDLKKFYENKDIMDAYYESYRADGLSIDAAKKEAYQDWQESFGPSKESMRIQMGLADEVVEEGTEVLDDAGRTKLLSDEMVSKEAADLLEFDAPILDEPEFFNRGGLVSLVKKKKKKRKIPKILKNRKLSKTKSNKKPKGVGQALRGFGAVSG